MPVCGRGSVAGFRWLILNPRPPGVNAGAVPGQGHRGILRITHPGHRQVFLPLGGKPFVAVLAPPTPGLPSPADFRAFRFEGSTGLMLPRGAWHEFPFALEPATDIVVILSRATNASLQANPQNEGEAIGPDLEKRNVRLRWTERLRVAPGWVSSPSDTPQRRAPDDQ